MPYGRRRRFKRRYTSRRSSFRRFTRPSRSFRRNVRSTIYRMSESKQGSRPYAASLLTTTITYFPLTPDISQGPGDNQRIGNKVMSNWFTIKMNFQLFPVVAGTVLDKNIRIWVVWPKNSSVSDTTSLFTSTNFPMFGMPDQDNFYYWRDQLYFRNTVAEPGRPDYIQFKMYKKFRYHLQYKQSGDTQPLMQPYLVVNYVPDPANLTFAVNGYIKMSYKDI